MNKDRNGIDIHAGLRTLIPSPVDMWSGPYESTEKANMVIPIAIRYRTMMVRIVNSKETFLYWYKDGVKDKNLVRYLNEDFDKIKEINTQISLWEERLINKENEVTQAIADVEHAANAMLSNIIGLEIEEDMNLWMSIPDTYDGIEFDVINGYLTLII